MGIFRKLFGAGKIVKAIEDGGIEETEKKKALELERIAIQTAVGYLASAITQCTFRAYMDGEENRTGAEFFLWNYSPNKNQSSTEFLWEVVETLLYNGEALIVEERQQLFLADGYSKEEDGTREQRYSGITVKGEAVKDRKESDVIRLKMENRNIRSLLESLCEQYEALISEAVEGYRKTYAEKGILSIDRVKSGKLDYETIKRDLINNRFRDFYSNKSAVLPLYDGYTYTPQTRVTRNTSEINDVKELSDEIYKRVGQAFRIPPSLLKGDTADLENASEMFLKYGVRPLCNLMEEEITRKRYGNREFEKGCYLTIDSSSIEISNVISAAEKLDKLIGCGIYSVDEVRDKIGEPMLGTPEAQKHYITKNYSEMKGGEENGKE